MIKIYTFQLIMLFMASVCIKAEPGVYEPDKLRVHIRMDKKVFFSDEEVAVSICVKNMSERKNYFNVYDTSDNESGKYVTFQPLVIDAKGRDAEIIVAYKIENKNATDLLQGLDKRMVELAPGEVFIHSVNLKEVYKLSTNKAYRIKSLFYPGFEEKTAITSDNELSFKIIDGKRHNKPSQVDAITRGLSPQEVILLALSAEKGKNWDNYVKYINIEKYINAYPEFVQKYLRANFEEKSQIEKVFIKYITRDRDDYLLDYKITKEEIENSKKIAYVDVIEDRFGIKWTYRYRYRYTLEQYKNMWLITDEEATVVKGARR